MRGLYNSKTLQKLKYKPRLFFFLFFYCPIIVYIFSCSISHPWPANAIQSKAKCYSPFFFLLFATFAHTQHKMYTHTYTRSHILVHWRHQACLMCNHVPERVKRIKAAGALSLPLWMRFAICFASEWVFRTVCLADKRTDSVLLLLMTTVIAPLL